MKKLSGFRLLAARISWISLVMISLGFYLIALPNFYKGVTSLTHPSFGFTEGWTIITIQQAMADLGISSQQWAIINIVTFLAFTGISILVGGIIFWRKSDEIMSLFTSLILILFGIYFNRIHETLVEPWLTVSGIFTFVTFVSFFLLFFLFPDGRFIPTWTIWLVPVWIGINLGSTFFPGTWVDLNHFPIYIQIPINLGIIFTFIYAQVYRYKHISDESARQQTKIVVRGLILALLGFFITGFLGRIIPTFRNNDATAFAYELIANVVVLFCVSLVPLSIGFAVLRNNLWGIEAVVKRTLVYFGLTTSVILIYAFIVGYFSAFFQVRNSPAVSLLAAGIIALLFQPLRDHMQRFVNRLMFGERDNPYKVVARLGHRLEATFSPDKVAPTIVETVADSLKIPLVSFWLVENENIKLAALHGYDSPKISFLDPVTVHALNSTPQNSFGVDITPDSPFGLYIKQTGISLVFPVKYFGESVGVLCLSLRSPGEPFTSADLHLLRDLAIGAGSAVQAAQLTLTLQERLVELRQSHERLLYVQEEERKRIQRDLHDGLGPVLASIRMRLEALVERSGKIAPDLLSELYILYDLISEATSDIRNMVYDLRPPLLDQLGLKSALRQRMDRLKREARIDVDWRFGENLEFTAAEETAIYRIVQEGVLNIQKHAQASQVRFSLESNANKINITLEDNGVGFMLNNNDSHSGAGIRSMRERAEMLGGYFCIASQIGKGTQVAVTIPLKKIWVVHDDHRNCG